MGKSKVRKTVVVITLAVVMVLASPSAYVFADGPEYADEPVPTVRTFAGIGLHGFMDGHMARFNLPEGIFAGEDGVFVADTFNNMIRFVTWEGETSTVTGNVTGLDDFRFPRGFYLDGPIESALFNRPTDVAIDTYGRLLITDIENNALRIIVGDRVFTYAGDGSPGHRDGFVSQALLNRPAAVAVDGSGDIFIADSGNHVIRRVRGDDITTIAGRAGVYGHNDGAAGAALFNSPMGIAVDGHGRIFVADTGNHLIRMIEDGRVSTVAGTLLFPGDIGFEVTYRWNEWDDVPLGGFADGDPGRAAFNAPMGLFVHEGMLIIADSGKHRIRALVPEVGVITLAGGGYVGHYDGIPSEAAFHLPSSVSVIGGGLVISDTGNNKIRILDRFEAHLEYLMQRP